jgi:protein tyrosine phosphatase (PTP) superfamily phosphohydrolase (DUF442 family)
MSTFDALSGLANACQATPTIVTGGQPTAEQIAAFKKAGGSVVLDIRDPMEPRPFDEPATVKGAGLEYVNVPVVSGQVGAAQIEKIHEVLKANEGKQILFHCASANRVGGTLIPYLMLDLGMEEEDATALAMRVGLRSAEYLSLALEYVAERK